MDHDKSNQITQNTGVLTLATGGREYVEMAVDMALSYKQFHSHPICCITDSFTNKIIKKDFPKVFEYLVQIPDKYNKGRIRKFCCAEVSPFENTLFLDADIIILKPLTLFWEEGKKDSIVFIGEYLTTQNDKIHHGYSTKELIETLSLNKYLKVNSGAFHFKKSMAKDFFDDCVKSFKKLELLGFAQKGWLGDEIAIGITADYHSVKHYNIPSQMMWPDELNTLSPRNIKLPICHFIGYIPPKTVKWFVENQKELRKQKNIPTGGSEIWKKTNKMYAPNNTKLIHRVMQKLGINKSTKHI